MADEPRRYSELPRQAEKIPSLYAIVLAVLGVALLIGVSTWAAIALMEPPAGKAARTMPDGLATITALIAGGLIGVLAPSPRSHT